MPKFWDAGIVLVFCFMVLAIFDTIVFGASFVALLVYVLQVGCGGFWFVRALQR